jgi:chromosome segregation ATPase
MRVYGYEPFIDRCHAPMKRLFISMSANETEASVENSLPLLQVENLFQLQEWALLNDDLKENIKRHAFEVQQQYTTALKATDNLERALKKEQNQVKDHVQGVEDDEHPEVRDLRLQLDDVRSKLADIDELQQGHNREIASLNRQKEEITYDIEAYQAKRLDFLETQLMSGVKEEQMSVIQGQTQLETLRKDYEEKKTHFQDLVREKESLLAELANWRRDMEKATEAPFKIQDQCEQLRKRYSTISHELVRQDNILKECEDEIADCVARKKDNEDLTVTLRADYEKRKLDIGQLEREMDRLNKEKIVTREIAMTQKEERERLDEVIAQLMNKVRFKIASMHEIHLNFNLHIDPLGQLFGYKSQSRKRAVTKNLSPADNDHE